MFESWWDIMLAMAVPWHSMLQFWPDHINLTWLHMHHFTPSHLCRDELLEECTKAAGLSAVEDIGSHRWKTSLSQPIRWEAITWCLLAIRPSEKISASCSVVSTLLTQILLPTCEQKKWYLTAMCLVQSVVLVSSVASQRVLLLSFQTLLCIKVWWEKESLSWYQSPAVAHSLGAECYVLSFSGTTDGNSGLELKCSNQQTTTQSQYIFGTRLDADRVITVLNVPQSRKICIDITV